MYKKNPSFSIRSTVFDCILCALLCTKRKTWKMFHFPVAKPATKLILIFPCGKGDRLNGWSADGRKERDSSVYGTNMA